MQQACGWLRWPPEAFWNATLSDIHSALVGHLESKGVAPKGAKSEIYDELLDMARKARAEERKAERAAAKG